MKKVTVPLELTIGALEEVGSCTLKQQWVASESDDGSIKFNITCGAGVGSTLLEASADEGTRSVYARADITQFGAEIFNALTDALRQGDI